LFRSVLEGFAMKIEKSEGKKLPEKDDNAANEGAN
jgi:hypothetical protein